MVEIRRVTGQFSVAPQVGAEDFKTIAAAGFRHVINNRPDGEMPGQLTSASAKAAAEAAGVTYHHAPFQGMPTDEALNTLESQLSTTDGPVLAYCRTGTRSITAWAILQAQLGETPVESILAAASQAGYDLSAMKDSLRSIAKG